MPPTTKPANVSDASWAIWLDVKANSAKLEACAGPHDFIDDPAEAHKPLFRRKLCTKCGGTVDGINARWYQDGLKHAREASAK